MEESLLGTENQRSILQLRGYTLVEYTTCEGPVTIKLPNGNLKHFTNLSRVLHRIRKTQDAFIEKQKKREEALIVAQEKLARSPKHKILTFIKEQNLILEEPYTILDKSYHITCKKHNKTIERNLSSITPDTRKIKELCPECRREAIVAQYNKSGICPNLIITNAFMDEINHHKRLKCTCKFCGHEFDRLMDVVKSGGTDCPKCGIYRKKNKPHLYEQYDTYRKECDDITQKNLLRFSSILDIKEGMTIDHKFSCRNGYDNHIPPWIVAMPYNLEWMSMTENHEKHKRNSLSLTELLVSLGKFLSEYPWYGESFDKS